MNDEYYILLLVAEFITGKCYNTQNPYTRECVNQSLKYLAAKHDISDYMDVLDILNPELKERKEDITCLQSLLG